MITTVDATGLDASVVSVAPGDSAATRIEGSTISDGSNSDAPCGAFDFNADGAVGLDDFASWSNLATELP